jgi:protein involved in ribonucleotide reduction
MATPEDGTAPARVPGQRARDRARLLLPSSGVPVAPDFLVVYFSNVSENTHRFVEKLRAPRVLRIPVDGTVLEVDEPFLLVAPTYGSGRGTRMAPIQVTKFLANEANASLMRGLAASGNTSFGADFCKIADELHVKHGVPVVHRFEIMGMTPDVLAVQAAMGALLEAEVVSA